MPVVYTDGGHREGRAGIGVWFGENDQRNLSEPFTDRPTSQRAELYAIRRALEVTEGSWTIRTDSRYAIGALTEWCHKWRQNGWRNSKGHPVKNQDLIRPILTVLDLRAILMEHVKGHSGEPGNEGADALATKACLLK